MRSQNYQMHNYSKFTSGDTVTESQIYEDLSQALAYFKRKLKQMMPKPQHSQQLREQGEGESRRWSWQRVREKYRQGEINARVQTTIQRFMARLKESIRQYSAFLPKIKLDLTLSIRKLELTAFQLCESNNHRAALALILEYIHTFNIQTLAQRNNTTRSHNKSVITTNVVRLDPPTLTNNHSADNLKGKRQTEAQLFVRNAQKYACVDIDIEYLRGRYFDLKQQDHQLLEDAYARNSNIKRAMTSFEKIYHLAKHKPLPKSRSEQYPHTTTRNKSKPKTQYLKSSLQQPINQNEDPFNKSTKQNNYFSHASQEKTNERMATQLHIEPRTFNDTFRSVYQEKLRERKSNAVKLKNVAVIICDDDSTQYVKNINTKRMQFFKKSQEQTRLRYKYYNYVRKQATAASSHSMKYKSNYQPIFTTLTYK